MNRLLIPLALVALVAGCAMPGLFGQQAGEPEAADTARTFIVREIYHETPVYYVDTVYMAADPEPVQPVYVQNEYNEYNEYNHTDVYVHQRVVVPPSRPHDERGRPPRDRGRQPRDGSGYGKPRDRRDQPRDQEQPNVPVPKPPQTRRYESVTDDRQKAPTQPTQPTQPVNPKRQAPARDGHVQVTQVHAEAPRQAPTPKGDKPVVPASDEVRVQVGMSQAGTGLSAPRGK